MLFEMDGKPMTQLLLELFGEEIPARMQEKAANQMLEALTKELNDAGISFTKSENFSGARRITLFVDGLPSLLPEKIIEKKGPKIDAKTEALAGFLKSVQMRVEDLDIKDGFYYAKKTEKSKSTDSSLVEIINQILISFTWPKSMRISEERFRWVRPLRNILCIFAGKILPVKFSSLEANNYSFGHRFMSPAKLQILSFEDYLQKMNSSYVVLSSKERKKQITTEAEKIAKNLGLKVIMDQGLLDEVSGLVEFPNVLLGKIDKEFIDLPKEVLVSAMKIHQRYFYLEDNNGNIAPYFIFVSNVKYEDDNLIIEGNQKVLKARLSDAKFFWEIDLQHPFSENLAKLAHMTFHNKLGSMFDKTNRIIELANFIAKKLDYDDLLLVKKSALLAKTDLVSEMVGEFPELQGIMGKYYAEKFGEEKEVALSIAEHYRPIDANDVGDISKLGAIIAIADKIDNIVGLWFVGEKPTSSKDPLALRRAALGVIKLIRYHKMNFSLEELILEAAQIYKFDSNVFLEGEILTFFNDRLKYYLKAENFRHDLIASSIKEKNSNIYGSIEKALKMQDYVNSANADKLIYAIKRIYNIISASKIQVNLDVQESLFNNVEQDLYNAVKKIQELENIEELEILIPLIDKFFEEILVNDPDHKLKQNRLNLLYNIITLSQKIADFQLLEKI